MTIGAALTVGGLELAYWGRKTSMPLLVSCGPNRFPWSSRSRRG